MATSSQSVIRRFGSPGPGIEVLERSSTNALADPSYGTVAMWGVTKRGPMGVAIPISGRKQYDEIFGDPRDPYWHLFRDGSHSLPDAVDGFFSTGLGYGTLWLTRLELDGSARKAEITIKGRHGGDVLKIYAANEGRWGGQSNKVADTPIIYATARTFTLAAPGVKSNEFAGSTAEFSSNPGKKYKIVANTGANSSGEVVFTVAAQYSLTADGISGPTSLPGLASYSPTVDLEGSIAFSLLTNITGTVNINSRTLVGTGTQFTTELAVGRSIYYGGEVKVVESITSDTTLTVSTPFTANVTEATAQRDNLTVVGTGTAFTTQLVAGESISVMIGGVLQTRRIASITSNTSLELTSGFTSAIASGTVLKKANKNIVSTVALGNLVSVGDYLVDPNRQASPVKVVGIAPNGQSGSLITIENPLSMGFADAQLVKQTQRAKVYLDQPQGTGLTVEIGQGARYPETHFSLSVKFNNSSVLTINDASLDPDDPLFVEPLVNDSNIAYRTGSQNYQKWITAEVLWNSSYTTAPGDDVRPCNGFGEILLAVGEKLYTVADIDYIGIANNILYPNPYRVPRNYFRVKNAIAPKVLTGTISSLGINVTGVSTLFNSEVRVGDYLYDSNTNTVRKVVSITANTSLVIESPFPANISPLSTGKIAGNLQVDPGYDLSLAAQDSEYFLVTHPQNLIKGYDGDTATMMPYYFTRYADPDRNFLENAVFGRNMGLIRMSTPGISDIAVQKAFSAYAEARAYEFRGEIPSSYNASATAESFINEIIGRNDFVTYAFPSYGFISNPFGAGDRYVPLTGDIMGGESYRSSIAEGYHSPFAGVNATLSRIIKLPFEPTPNDTGVLNTAGIQPVKSLSGNVVVFGVRTPSLNTSYDFTHIRRIQSNYIRLFLEARNLLEMMFLPTQPNLVEQIIMILNNFARREYRKGVFSQFLNFEQAVSIDTGGLSGSGRDDVVINDNAGRDALVEVINGRLSIYFSYVPTGVLEKLSINCGPDILVANYGSASNTSNSF